MERIKQFWYRLVAKSLVEKLCLTKDNYQTILRSYCKLANENAVLSTQFDNAKNEVRCMNERMHTENRDGAIAVQVIRERMKYADSPAPSILSTHTRASKQRIVELERENHRLQSLLKSLHKS